MNAKVLKLLSLVLALAMVFCVFAGCSGNESDGSGEDIIYVDQDGNPIDPNEIGKDNDKDNDEDDKDTSSKEADKTESKTDTADKNDKDTSSKKGMSAAQQGGNKDKNNKVEKPGKTTFAADPYSEISKDLKGSTVTVLLWRPPIKIDTELVAGFEKKTGIKVNLINTENNTAAYTTKLASLIASGEAPDVVNIGSGTFLSYAITSLEPLDENVFRLDDKIWNKSVMDTYKINGKYYGLAVAGTWYCDDTSIVTYYNPKYLKDTLGVTTMPWDLYKAGKWTTDAVESIARKCKEKSKDNVGISIQTQSVSNPYMLAAGQDFAKFNGKEYTSNLSNSVVLEKQSMLAGWYEDKIVTGWDSAGLVSGKIALFDAISYGMYSESNWWMKGDGKTPEDHGALFDCVPVAGTHTPANAKLWGVAKGAKNVEAAVFFMRYFLDPASYADTSFKSFKNTFADAQMYDVWQEICSADRPKGANISAGLLSYYDTSAYNNLNTKLSQTTAANVKSVLDSYGSTMKAACNKAAKYLGRVQKNPSYVK